MILARLRGASITAPLQPSNLCLKIAAKVRVTSVSESSSLKLANAVMLTVMPGEIFFGVHVTLVTLTLFEDVPQSFHVTPMLA